MANDFDQSLSTLHISNALNDYEAARTGFFVLEVHGLDRNPDDERSGILKPSFSGDPESAKETDYIQNAEKNLRLNVIKCPIPHFNITTNEYRRGNDVVKFAGIPTWDDGDIVVDDIVGLDTKSILMGWLYRAYNPWTRKGGRMWQYKKEATLIEYTQDYEQIRRWNIHGIFITKLNEGEFDRENDGKRQITASFSYDRAEVILPQEEEE